MKQRVFKIFVRSCLPLLGALLLTACGFQLRGKADASLSSRFATVYLSESLPREGFFYQRLHHLIIVNGGHPGAKETARTEVAVTPVVSKQRQIALSSSGTLKEYERTFTTVVTVTDLQSSIRLGSRKISSQKNIQLDDLAVLAGEEQSSIIRKAAERDLAQAVIRYLESF